MLLQRLREYSYRLDLPPSLYAETPIRYIVDLGADGTPATRITDTADATSPADRRGVRRLAPQVKRAIGIKPLLLADNAEYTFGLPRDESKAVRVAKTHEAYLDLIDACAAATRHPAVAAVRCFLADHGFAALEAPGDFDRGALITFRVEGDFVIDVPAVQAFWAATNAADDAPVMACLICGQERPVLERLQANIRGGLIPGGQTAGTSIISANAAAFESHGLEASLTAPTCSDCGERFTKALNHLLSDEDSRIRLGDGSVTAFWTRDETARNPFNLLNEARPEDVNAFLASLHEGRRRSAPDPNRFFAAALSAAGGRAVVREWIDVTLPEAEASLEQWFARQAVIDAATGERRYFSLRGLAAATVRELRDISPPTVRTLLRCALTGTPLPLDMLAAAVQRARADRRVTAPQAALIKLVLVSRGPREEEEDLMVQDQLVQLDPTRASTGYHCGRLLAVLEAVQRAALPNVKAGIVDRYFGSASSSPGAVFPRLVRGAQPHLGRLERDRPAAHVALQRRMEDVLARLPEFPRILTLKEQGNFALGYYHQRAEDRAQQRAAIERRQAGTATSEDTGIAEIEDASEEADD